MNKNSNIKNLQIKYLNGSGILNLFQQLFEQGSSFSLDKTLNSLVNSNPTDQNFILYITKKTNLILGVKILNTMKSNIKITKISFYQNFNFYDKSTIKTTSTDDFYLYPITFSVAENTLSIENYLEIKILDLNILGKNMIYKIEYSNDVGNAITFDGSCVLFEEIKIDQNFQTFFDKLNYEKLNPLPGKGNSNNLGIIIGIILGVITLGSIFIGIFLCKRNKNLNGLNVKSVSGHKAEYNNLELGSKIVSKETNNLEFGNNKIISRES